MRKVVIYLKSCLFGVAVKISREACSPFPKGRLSFRAEARGAFCRALDGGETLA